MRRLPPSSRDDRPPAPPGRRTALDAPGPASSFALAPSGRPQRVNGHLDLARGLPDCLEFVGEPAAEEVRRLWAEHGQDSLQRLRGGFALAAADAKSRAVVLARDALGRKPLYYCLSGTRLWYGTRVPKGAPRGAIDRGALSDYLELGFIPAPATTWSGVRKVPPGHLVRRRAAGAARRPWSESPVRGSRTAGDGGPAPGDRRRRADRGWSRRAVRGARALSARRPDPGAASGRERREPPAEAGAGATPRNAAPRGGHAADHRPRTRPRDDRDLQLRGARGPARGFRAHRSGIARGGSRRARGGAGVRSGSVAARRRAVPARRGGER